MGIGALFRRYGEELLRLATRATVTSVWPKHATVDLASAAGLRAGDTVRAAGGAWPARPVPRDNLGPEVSIRARPVSPVVAGIGDRHQDARWGLGENTFVALFPDAGRVLLRADGHDMAFEFRQGRGRVVHTVGQIYLRAGNHAGFVVAHRLLLNVLLERFGN